jgi:hypothetical protein
MALVQLGATSSWQLPTMSTQLGVAVHMHVTTSHVSTSCSERKNEVATRYALESSFIDMH